MNAPRWLYAALAGSAVTLATAATIGILRPSAQRFVLVPGGPRAVYHDDGSGHTAFDGLAYRVLDKKSGRICIARDTSSPECNEPESLEQRIAGRISRRRLLEAERMAPWAVLGLGGSLVGLAALRRRYPKRSRRHHSSPVSGSAAGSASPIGSADWRSTEEADPNRTFPLSQVTGGTVALSEGARAFRDRMVGVWEIEGERYVVFPGSKGGLEAKSLTTGKEVGAGLPISGTKIGLLPEDFKPE